MTLRRCVPVALSLGLLSAVVLSRPAGVSHAETPPAADQPDNEPQDKPFSPSTQKALEYLVSQQDTSGGWGQGGGWRQGSNGKGRQEGPNVQDPPDLGNTCIATLALIRAGNTPTAGDYATNVARAVNFICAKVEKSDNDGLYVTDVRDTQLQQKIGPYVDTFLAGLVLSELKIKVKGGGDESRVLAALDKTIRKIEKNQKADGTFAGNGGWASVLSQGLASKALNRAAQGGVALNESTLKRDYEQTVAAVDAAKTSARPSRADLAERRIAARSPVGTVTAPAAAPVSGGTDAGIELYSFTANAGRLSDFNATNVQRKAQLEKLLAKSDATGGEKNEARLGLAAIEKAQKAQDAAVNGVVGRLKDRRFVAGFGNNGGEEFLSYMNVSEMLAAKGGKEWEQWDAAVAQSLANSQNADGSWSGHHCITGRTFCTSAAVLTMLADRAPRPDVAADAQPQATAPVENGQP